MSALPIVIVGAGLAGLNCARLLHHAGRRVLVLDAADGIGGRVRTDSVDGFQLDRGFQVLQTAYPEARAGLDYAALNLQNFEPGAQIRTQRGWATMVDPWRRPRQLFKTAFNEIGTFSDRLRLAKLRRRARQFSNVANSGSSVQSGDRSTMEFLRDECGFSSDFIERFLRPWIRGMFFDEELQTSSQFFQFVFCMLADGDAALPSAGMGAIPQQLAQHLPTDSVRCSTRVSSLSRKKVTTSDGATIDAESVVLATDGIDAQQLIGNALKAPTFQATSCLYYAADHPPAVGRSLALNGQGEGPISNVSVPSNLAPQYAPEGQSLVCVSLRSGQVDEGSEAAAVKQLGNWFGSQVASWKLLKRYDIARAIPSQLPGSLQLPQAAKIRDGAFAGVFVCGDHCQTASIQGAMLSGRLAAEAILAEKADS